MKIALLRYNLPIHLRLESGLYVGGCDEHLDFLKALITAGHEVYIYSDVYREDYKWWLEKGYKNTPYDFLGALKIEQTQYIDPDINHCIIECGTTTLLFRNKENLPYIMKCSDQIIHFQGVVYYWQSDGVLPIALHPEKFKYDFMANFGYELNFRRMMKNKIWVILHRCEHYNENIILDKNMGTRFQYRQHKEEGHPIYAEFLPISFPYWVFEKPFRKPKRKPKHFITYTGNQRSRIRKFRKYYGDVSDNFQVTIAGKWNEQITEQYPKIKWLGKLKQQEMRPLLHNSRCQILIGDRIYDEYNWITSRVPDCISAGCIVLPDLENQSPVYKKLGYGFNNYDELEGLLYIIESTSYIGVKEIVEKQKNVIKRFNTYLIIGYMDSIFAKYNDMLKHVTFSKWIAGKARIARKELLTNKPQVFGKRNKGNQSKKTKEKKLKNLRKKGLVV